jgi:solute carrier family 1 (high affinity glutamate transporter) protein 1
MRLHNLIFLCMAVGIVAGLFLSFSEASKDEDKDGYVSQQEYERASKEHRDRAKAFARADREKKGALTPAQAGLDPARFTALDANGDGRLTYRERHGANEAYDAEVPAGAPGIPSGWFLTVIQWLDFFGRTIFIGALKMIIAPLILVSIVAGVTSIASFGEAGRIGFKTLVYYVGTTTIAVGIGLVLVLSLQPGNKGHARELREERAAELALRRIEFQEATQLDPADEANAQRYHAWLAQEEGRKHGEKYRRVVSKRDRGQFEMFVEDIVRPMLTNPFRSLTERNSLGIIFWALLLGLACIAVGAAGKPVVDFFQGANEVMLLLTRWIMAMSPFAILCLMGSIVATHGPRVFESLGWYSATVIGGIVLHVGVLLTICALIGRVSPLRFLRGIREAWAIAFSTRSSAATLPVTIRCVEKNLGVSPKVANFTLPVGATINMDGTALYEGVAVIFLIQIYGGMDDVGITLGGAVTLIVFITAVLASVGAAAVPDAGLVTMVLVATAVHLPVYYLPFIFAVDAFLDMFRTSTNVMGDAVGAVVVNRFERPRLAPPEAAEGT